MNGYKDPQRDTLWDFYVAKSRGNIILPSIREKTSKSPPHVEKYQQNCSRGGHIHKGTKPPRPAWYRAEQTVLCYTDATRSEAEVEVRPLLYIPRKLTDILSTVQYK